MDLLFSFLDVEIQDYKKLHWYFCVVGMMELMIIYSVQQSLTTYLTIASFCSEEE